MAITLTREELYDRVWTKPVDVLAAELRLSGRGLGKLCARFQIPVPPLGYWAKKSAGKRVGRPKLPEADAYRQTILFAGPTDLEPADPQSDDHPLIAFERAPANVIVVPTDTAPTHPLVLKAARGLTGAQRDKTGRTLSRPGRLRIHTSRPAHERALRIAQLLLTALEHRGFEVDGAEDGMRVTALGEPLAIGIEEETKRVEHRVTFTEQKQIDRGWGYKAPSHDEVPSGALTLVITNVSHMRHRFTESRKPLEEMLNRFVIGLVRAALGLKRQRAEAEARAKKEAEEQRLREEEPRRLAEAVLRWREEEGRIERLDRLADMWRRSLKLKDLVSNVQHAVGLRGEPF